MIQSCADCLLFTKVNILAGGRRATQAGNLRNAVFCHILGMTPTLLWWLRGFHAKPRCFQAFRGRLPRRDGRFELKSLRP